MTIKQLRILPPFAIGRLGSAAEPLDNYTAIVNSATDHNREIERPLDFRRIQPAETLYVDENSGQLKSRTPDTMTFKQRGKIRPVAPFLEVFAVTRDDVLEPLTLDLLQDNSLGASNVSWSAIVANRKVVRRTDDENDLVEAKIGWFNDHQPHQLKGKSNNFIKEKFIDFGHVRFIKPNEEFPAIRLRFTPAKGLIYGPKLGKPDPHKVIPDERAIYDTSKGCWYRFGEERDDDANKRALRDGDDSTARPFRNETVPPSLFAIEPPAPPWLFDNKAVSRGYLDDACDGFVEVKLTLADGSALTARARICAAPPALVPDSLFVRCLADDLDQVINGPDVSPDEPEKVTRARAEDIIRRAYETVRFMNVAVMNGNDFKGRPALSLDSMPEEEAADTERAIRPIMAPGTVDTLAIMALHQQVYAALRGGAAPWFVRLLRRPDEVADFTDRGRRKMPALMCGADNNYLALTYRQIATLEKAAGPSMAQSKPCEPSPPGRKSLLDEDDPLDVWKAPVATLPPLLKPRNLSAQINYKARGNPISSGPIASVANCCPGLEVDFRAVWRRMFKGIVLREYDNLVIDVDPDCEANIKTLKWRRLLRVFPPGHPNGIPMMTQIKGPASSDPDGEIRLTTELNPSGLAALEWSNALAHVLSGRNGNPVRCDFSKDVSRDEQQPWNDNYESFFMEVRPFFDDDTAVISKVLADAGELTQGLCSPWQNDYRECSCYYWASARPDYVNVEPTTTGLSNGDNWLQKKRTGDYVPDDYADSRLILYDDLFREWEHWLRFQVGGRDLPDPDAAQPESAKDDN